MVVILDECIYKKATPLKQRGFLHLITLQLTLQFDPFLPQKPKIKTLFINRIILIISKLQNKKGTIIK